jgi:parallel beta-helix repeat protein
MTGRICKGELLTVQFWPICSWPIRWFEVILLPFSEDLSMFGPILQKALTPKSCRSVRNPARAALRVENLEDRTVPTVLTVGVGQQFATIGAAIAAAPAGAEIDVYSGTYTEQLVDATGLQLIAKPTSGAVVIAAPATLTGNGAVIEITTAAKAKLSGFTIDASHATNANFDVLVDAGGSATISNNTILGPVTPANANLGIGVQVGFNGTGGVAKVNSNAISGYEGAGVVVDGSGGSASIKNNTITGRGTANAGIVEYGVQVSNGATARVENNTISGNTLQGAVPGGYNPNPTSAGIFFFQDGSKQSVAAGNTLSGNDDGVLVQLSSGTAAGAIQIVNNDVHGNFGYAGIFALSSNNVKIANNDVSNNSTFNGIAMNFSGGVQVEFNVVHDNVNADGIFDFQGNGNFIWANTAFSNGNNGINIDTTTNDEIWNNVTHNNTFSGIHVIGGSGNDIWLGTSNTNVMDGIRLENTTGNTIVGNAIQSNGGFGINLINAKNTLIAFNLITGNQAGAINIDANSTGTVQIANRTGTPPQQDGTCGASGTSSAWTNSHANADNDVVGLDDA